MQTDENTVELLVIWAVITTIWLHLIQSTQSRIEPKPDNPQFTLLSRSIIVAMLAFSIVITISATYIRVDA